MTVGRGVREPGWRGGAGDPTDTLESVRLYVYRISKGTVA